MEFKVIALKDAGIDIIDGDRGKNYPKKTEMTNQGHTLFLNNKNIINDYLDVTTGEFITENKSNELRKGKLIRDDIVMSTRGSVGNIGHYSENIALNNIRINSGMVILRNKNTQINTNYLYILLKSSYMKNQYLELISGSVQNQLPIRDLQHIKLRIPELIYQKKIVQVINNLEQKIFLNKKIISNFEQLSQTLFKHWFIDFEFPNEEGKPYKSSGGEMVESELGKLPKGWSIKSLDEIAKFQNGLAMQKFRPEENAGSLPVLKIKELNQGNTTLNSERCSLDIKKEVKVFDGDVIFSWSGTLLVKLWTGGAAGLNQHLFKVTSEKYEKWFYYLWTKHYLKIFQARAAEKATTMGHIKRSHLHDAKINLPPEEILTRTADLIQPIIEKIVVLGIENKNLTQLRDTLLPKLLSGEIEIPDDLEV